VGKVDVPALRGCGSHREAGEFLAIVGPPAPRKSTLFHIIGGLTPPTSGEVRVAGQDLAAMTEAGRTRLRKRSVAFVFQKFNLLPKPDGARTNIAIARHIGGSDSKPEASFEDVLRLLGIVNRLDHKPSELSGGEQQRVAIARAIVNHPAILLADEPTGNLDSESSKAVLEVLRGLNERLGQTILMITHNPEAAAYADYIVAHADVRIM